MNITVKAVATDSPVTALSVAIAVTLCTSLPQHCHFHCSHNAVLVFTATAPRSFSLSQCCAHRCPVTAVGFLLCTLTVHSMSTDVQRLSSSYDATKGKLVENETYSQVCFVIIILFIISYSCFKNGCFLHCKFVHCALIYTHI